jgi:hypothetical protein
MRIWCNGGERGLLDVVIRDTCVPGMKVVLCGEPGYTRFRRVEPDKCGVARLAKPFGRREISALAGAVPVERRPAG